MIPPYSAGEHVYLRAPSMSDAEGDWVSWMNDEETTKWLVDQYWPKTVADQKAFIETTNKEKSRLLLMIADKKSDTLIGVCSLSSINYVHRYCSLTVIMGEKGYRQGKHLVETISLLLRVAFKRLNMRSVRSAYVDGNEASALIHRLFHFVDCGAYPETFWDGEIYRDLKLFNLTQNNWSRRNSD